MQTMTIEEVIAYLENDNTLFVDYAFRGDDFIPNGKFNNSRYHGDETDSFELPGVSAIFLPAKEETYIRDSIQRALRYGKHVFLLAGEAQNAHEIYHDPREVLMIDPRIVCIVQL